MFDMDLSMKTFHPKAVLGNQNLFTVSRSATCGKILFFISPRVAWDYGIKF